MRLKRYFLILVIVLFSATIISAQDDDLLDMSFEELLDMEITSASKKAERLQDVPNSIYVITSEDIERSSSQNIMQLLREHVPGYWAVANDYGNADAFIRNANEGSVLVLLDGTPMFGQLFSSFDFENFEIPFSQIERIEVIKGSGGTVYGANSATGVVSIFTKNPSDNNKLFASAEYAYPGKATVNFIGTPIKSDKFGATVYGKYSAFNGFEQMPEVTNATSVVPKTFGSRDTTITNRFTGDDNSVTTAALGLNLEYKLTDKLTLSSNVHYNSYKTQKYYQFLLVDEAFLRNTGDINNPSPFMPDSVALKNADKSRMVANVQFDYQFSDKHSLFARAATNRENSNFTYAGGFRSKNNIVDFEIQDNFELPYNSISIGGNYRNVNFDLSEFGSTDQVYYTETKRTEALIGFFIQDKISLLSGKLNFYLGLKAENFSLINNKFYLSPMAKFTVLPSDNLSIWGGYSKSYTTPGYNQTSIEYSLFRAETPKVFYDLAYPLVNFQTYYSIVQQGIDGGLDPDDAAQQAQAYMESPEGVYLVDSLTNQNIASSVAPFPGHLNISAISSPNTKPTSFDNFELGLRVSNGKMFSFETSIFYSIMKDGIGNAADAVDTLPSLAHEGEFIAAYYYGNYYKGTNMGIESVIKSYPISNLMVELSHSWFKYTLDYQNNEDFNVNSDATIQSKELLVLDKYKQIPEHIFRAKLYYTLNDDWKFSFTSMYATSFYVRFGIVESTYEYDNQRFDALTADGGNQFQVGGEHNNKFALNLRIDKYFFDKQLNVFVYGNDILAGNYVEGVNQLETIYPRQVGSMFGAGVSYRIK